MAGNGKGKGHHQGNSNYLSRGRQSQEHKGAKSSDELIKEGLDSATIRSVYYGCTGGGGNGGIDHTEECGASPIVVQTNRGLVFAPAAL